MFWSIAIAVILGIVATGVTVLAGHLAATKAWHKWFFWLSGAVMVLLISVQAYRSVVSFDHLVSQLSSIQANTKPPGQHTQIAFVNPIDPDHTMELPFRPSERPQLNVSWINDGNYSVVDARCGADIVVIATDERQSAFDRFRGRIKPNITGGVFPPHTSYASTYTFYGPEISKDQADKLNSGTDALCVLAIVDWADQTGNYETDQAECLIRNTPGKETFNWHQMRQNDRETRLP